MSPHVAPDERLATRLDVWRARFIEVEPRIEAFVHEPGRFERVGAEASAIDPNRPLAGLLLGVKDIFHVDGQPTRAGSQLPVSVLAGAEGPAVVALRRAGAIVAGKTVTTEFAYFSPGPTRNPANLEHTPGGSSSGSAAAVAAELCDLALGTQTIGSIGRPAAFCGVVGWKPSHERVSRDGVIPLAPSLDHVGLFARDVATIARAAPLVAVGWRALRFDAKPLRLAVVRGPYLDALSEAGAEHFARLRGRLERAGHELVEVDAMAGFAGIAERHRRLVAFEAAEVHADWFDEYGDLYAPKTVELLRRGRKVAAAEAERGRAGRLDLRAELERVLDAAQADLFLSPPAVGPAPRGLESTGDPVMNLPWTHAGLPTLVVPAGRSAARFGEPLPMGAQLAARFGADEELLARGEALAAGLSGTHEETVP